jgi:imidazoleglycerol-phosphate dehydratase
MRQTEIRRKTTETDIVVRLSLDGSGEASIHTGIGFFDHMLQLLARHARLDLVVEARGDLDTDDHHTAEDVGIVLGQAIGRALGDKRGIQRYGHAVIRWTKRWQPRRSTFPAGLTWSSRPNSQPTGSAASRPR